MILMNYDTIGYLGKCRIGGFNGGDYALDAVYLRWGRFLNPFPFHSHIYCSLPTCTTNSEPLLDDSLFFVLKQNLPPTVDSRVYKQRLPINPEQPCRLYG